MPCAFVCVRVCVHAQVLRRVLDREENSICNFTTVSILESLPFFNVQKYWSMYVNTEDCVYIIVLTAYVWLRLHIIYNSISYFSVNNTMSIFSCSLIH